jgi:hypothetical protein
MINVIEAWQRRAIVAAASAAFVALAGASSAHAQPAPAAASAAAPGAPTFAKDVAPIFASKCNECHQRGSIAPMPLVTYADTRPWVRSIKARVASRQMPPWHIDKSVGVQKFKNDMSLSDAQIDTIVRWADSGAAAGDPRDMPPPPKPMTNEWRAVADGLGQPDLVVKSTPYTMKPQQHNVWWQPTVDIPVSEPRWIKAVEIRPTTLAGRRIVHHAVTYLIQDDPDSQNALPAAGVARERTNVIMEWAIGKGYDLFRPDTGKLLLPGAQLRWDMHLAAADVEIRDSAELGIWLYPKGQEPKHRTYLMTMPAQKGRDARASIDIPPNTIVQNEGFTLLRSAAILENFQPHMHLRGKAMSIEAILPDGTVQPINYVGNFNFNWMISYHYEDDAAPVLPKGTIIHITAWHDNTAANKNNPDPNQWVGFGQRTVDEMGHAQINLTYISDDEYNEWQRKQKQSSTSIR